MGSYFDDLNSLLMRECNTHKRVEDGRVRGRVCKAVAFEWGGFGFSALACVQAQRERVFNVFSPPSFRF